MVDEDDDGGEVGVNIVVGLSEKDGGDEDDDEEEGYSPRLGRRQPLLLLLLLPFQPQMADHASTIDLSKPSNVNGILPLSSSSYSFHSSDR